MLLDLRGSGPLYRRVYHALKSGIRGGRFGPATRLPSTRGLAADLGVSRNTIMLAYEQLQAEGYVVSRDRSTTLVAGVVPPRPLPELPEPPTTRARLSAYALRLTRDPAMPPSGSYASGPGIRYDFRYGRPAVDEFPRDIWRRLLAARARRPGRDALGYTSPAGYVQLRAALVDYLKRARGLSCDAGQIVIVNGSQQAIDLAARVLLDPRDAAIVEEPHYPGATLAFEAIGARLIRIPTDAQGLDTARLPPSGDRARLAYVTPCHQFPTGVIMPLERRLALLDWAARSDAWIVEDDYVSEFRYEGSPLEAMQALDRNGRVIYIGSFSKTLFPALRLAYVVLPRPLVRPFLAAKWVSDRFSTMLPQEALADFIASGQFERYLRRAGSRNAARRRALIGALTEHFGERIEIAGENTGVHLMVWLNDVGSRNVGALIERAARAGVGLYPITPYYSRPPRRAGLLFGYAALTEADIRAGIRRFAEVF
ncbi:MAG TPA: PLP-dependent aminotransferase family protein [Burkholderiales bacterium]|nr:PLP-dependent aminotransferase family protein [Burkholderiales bacterium]